MGRTGDDSSARSALVIHHGLGCGSVLATRDFPVTSTFSTSTFNFYFQNFYFLIYIGVT